MCIHHKFIHNLGSEYNTLLSMCAAGTAFSGALCPPVDENEKVEMLKPQPRNVRSSNTTWTTVAKSIDAFLNPEGMRFTIVTHIHTSGCTNKDSEQQKAGNIDASVRTPSYCV